MICIPEHISNLKPYKPGNKLNDTNKSISDFINLASNENPLGASPLAIKELQNVARFLSIYPDVSSNELVNFIAQKMNLNPETIICGHGSDSLIADIIKTFSNSDDEILTSEGSFIGYYVNVLKLGRKLIKVPLREYSYDLNEIANAVTSKTKIIFLANPNNPTGTIFNKDQFDSFMQKIPQSTLVVLDEAYHAYSILHDDYPDGLEFNYDNFLILRTLSKSHGLAGLRIGYCIGPSDLIAYLYRVKLPFEPNTIAQRLAKAAFADDDFLFQVIKLNTISLERLKNFFTAKEIYYPKPAANFIMIPFSSYDEAQRFTELCYQRSILVRHLTAFGINNGVRISTGTHEQMDIAIDTFNYALSKI